MKNFDNIQVYRTGSGLGYQQYAYLVNIGDSENPVSLVIDTTCQTDYYTVGKLCLTREFANFEPCDYKVSQSPLYGTFLFDTLLNTLFYIQEKVEHIDSNIIRFEKDGGKYPGTGYSLMKLTVSKEIYENVRYSLSQFQSLAKEYNDNDIDFKML